MQNSWKPLNFPYYPGSCCEAARLVVGGWPTSPALHLMAEWKSEFGSNNRKNIGECLKGITAAFPENTPYTFGDYFKNVLRASGCLSSGSRASRRRPRPKLSSGMKGSHFGGSENPLCPRSGHARCRNSLKIVLVVPKCISLYLLNTLHNNHAVGVINPSSKS